MEESVQFLQIEPTTRCNFTCGFCAGRYMEQADLPFERFTAALEVFPNLRHMELQGEGEPLLHPRFFDMIDLARRRGIAVSFITNGSLISPAAAAAIVGAGVTKVSVSLESADPKRFQSLRGGTLDKVLRGVQVLLATRSERGLRLPVVGLSITVLRGTRHDLGAMLALYERLGLDGGITLQPLQGMDAYARHYTPALRAEMLSTHEADQLWGAFFADARVRRIQQRRASRAGFFDQLMDGWRPAQRSCPWLDRALYVHNSGAVTACCMIKDTDRFSFGRLGETSVGEILAERAHMRATLAQGKIPAPCEGCELARFAVMGRGALLRFALRGLGQRLLGSRRTQRTMRLPVLGQG